MTRDQHSSLFRLKLEFTFMDVNNNILLEYLGLSLSYPLKYIESFEEFMTGIKLNVNENVIINERIKQLDFSCIGSLYAKTSNIINTLQKNLKNAHGKHDKIKLNKTDFQMGTEEFDFLRAVLQDNKISCGSLSEIMNSDYNPYIEKILQQMYYNNGKASSEVLSIRSREHASKELWQNLLANNILKEAKVNFKFTTDPDDRISTIKNKIENIVKKVFNIDRVNDSGHQAAEYLLGEGTTKSKNSKLDDMIDTITNVLKQAAGTMRTWAKVEIEPKLLTEMFEKGNVPPEIMDYALIAFEKVLDLKEKKGFDWDAFACAIIGVLQIVAGVALDIFTGGAAHYFAQALISEGIGDIIFAITASLEGNFSWESYAKYKVQSLIISLMTAGVGSYLGRGTQIAKLSTGLATKTAIFKSVTKAAFSKVVQGVITGFIQYGADKLTDIIMDEAIDKQFMVYFEKWIKTNAEFKQNKKRINKNFRQIYLQFGCVDAANIIHGSMQETIKELQTGSLSNAVFNCVMEISRGISQGIGNAASKLSKNNSKAKRFAFLSKTIHKCTKGAEFRKNFAQLCSLCNNFCELFISKLNSKCKNYKRKCVDEIKIENDDISINDEISKQMNLMEQQLYNSMKQKVKSSFLKPAILKTLQIGTKPLQTAILSPFENAMKDLQHHIEQRSDKYIDIIKKSGQNISSKLTDKKLRLLQKMGKLIDAKDIKNEAILQHKVANLCRQSVDQLIKQHGDGVRLVIKDQKMYAMIPSFTEFTESTKQGNFAGPMNVKIASEYYGQNIKILDAANNFRPHKHAPENGLITPMDSKRKQKASTSECLSLAYFQGDNESGNIGHYAPIIRDEHGNCKVIDLPQSDKTKNKCFPQCMLFLEMYNNKIKNGQSKESINIEEIKQHVMDDNSNHITKFNSILAKTARQSKQFKNYYENGITLKHSDFIGGQKRKRTDERDPPTLTPGAEIRSGYDEPFMTSKYRSHWSQLPNTSIINNETVTWLNFFHNMRIPTESLIFIDPTSTTGCITGSHPGAIRQPSKRGKRADGSTIWRNAFAGSSSKFHKARQDVVQASINVGESPRTAAMKSLAFTLENTAGIKQKGSKIQLPSTSKIPNEMITTGGHDFRNIQEREQYLRKSQCDRDIMKIYIEQLNKRGTTQHQTTEPWLKNISPKWSLGEVSKNSNISTKPTAQIIKEMDKRRAAIQNATTFTNLCNESIRKPFPYMQ
eukprot:347324_1